LSSRFAICNEIFDGWSPERAFDLIAEAGYDGVEVAPFTFGRLVTDVPKSEREAMCKLARSRGLEIVGLHWLLARTEGLHLNAPDAAVRARTVAYLQGLARFCADLGGRIMVFGSPQQRRVLPGLTAPQAWELAKESLAAALPVFRELGVTLCMEPLAPVDNNFVTTAAQARQLVDEIGHPNFRMMLDVKAMASEGRPIPDIIAASTGYVRHVHANDASGRGPGFGDTDFTPIAAALGATGYDGCVSVEVFDAAAGPEAIARRSLEVLRRAFDAGSW
jgi:sugar phosphate isomerase/epimerase